MARTDTGIDYSGFMKLVRKVDELGEDMEEIADEVLETGAEAAKAVYKNAMPFDDSKNYHKAQGHARDNLYLTKPKNSRRGNRYRVVRIRGDRSYLYMLNYGSSHYIAKPWIDKADEDVKTAAGLVMKDKLQEKIDQKLS